MSNYTIREIPATDDDLSGTQIGVVSVVRKVKDEKKWSSSYVCECVCGTKFVQEHSVLNKKQYKRCRCASFTHFLGMALTAMKARCENPAHPSYKTYGARGVRVCDEWVTHPARFFEWSRRNGWKEVPGYAGKNTMCIDRINSSGNYSPENCRWITKSENTTRALRKRWNPLQNSLEEARELLEYNGYTVSGRPAGLFCKA